MSFFTGPEILDAILMTLATGYIFMDMFKRPASDDPVEAYRQQSSFKERFLYSAALVAPAIILHELGHKFVAMSFGLEATFHAAYWFLLAGILLKLSPLGIIIIVPAYVRTVGATDAQSVWIAAAGPLVNLALFFVSIAAIQYCTDPKKITFWKFSKYINGFLCVFNFLPIPGFDGHTVMQSLLAIM